MSDDLDRQPVAEELARVKAGLRQIVESCDNCTSRSDLVDIACRALNGQEGPKFVPCDIEARVERLSAELEEVRTELNSEYCELDKRAKRLRELFELHNLLPFIAKGSCTCDASVGMAPCESCAAREILRRAALAADKPVAPAESRSAGRMHEECAGCALEGGEVASTQCPGHYQGPIACEFFRPRRPRRQAGRAEGGEDMSDLREDIRQVLNRHSAENASNTPDFILADFLLGCLVYYEQAIQARSKWYGHMDGIGGPIDLTAAAKPAEKEEKT
jgi:hypothetical protein